MDSMGHPAEMIKDGSLFGADLDRFHGLMKLLITPKSDLPKKNISYRLDDL
jgi:hypothetical protein